MKRWNTKTEKRLIGGLLLLLVISSLPWVDRNQLYSGFSALSSVINSEVADSNKPKEDPPKAPEKKSYKHTIYVPGKNGNDHLVQASCEEGGTCDITLTEAGTSADCNGGECLKKSFTGSYSVGAENANNSTSVFNQLKPHIAKLVNDPTPPKKDGEEKKVKVVKIKIDDKEDNKDDDDSDLDNDFSKAIETACLKGSKKDRERKKSGDEYTYCAMKKMASFARLSSDKRPTSEEMKDLLAEHVYENLLEQMKEGIEDDASGDDRSRMRKANREIENLVERLAGGRYSDVRKKLAEIKRLAMNERIKSTNKLLNEANVLAATGDFAGASMMLNEFQQKRISMTNAFNEDLVGMKGVYNRMVGIDGFTRSNSLFEYRDQYYNPYVSANNRLWSSNPTFEYNGYQGNRFARSGGVGPQQNDPRFRGGPQGDYPYNPNGHFRGPPIAGQRGQFGPGGVNPVAPGQPLPPGAQTAYHGPVGPNIVPGPGIHRFNAPYNNGFANNWANNGLAWTQQAGINGRVGFGVATPSPGIAGSGVGAYGAFGTNYYSGYSNYLYGNPGVARPPYAPGWLPGTSAMQQPFYGQGFGYGGYGSAAHPRF